MKRPLLLIPVLIGVLSFSPALVLAADPAHPNAKAVASEPIYGSELMTQYEKAVYRSKLLVAKSPKEQEQIRAEHRRQMRERAKARGVTLPN